MFDRQEYRKQYYQRNKDKFLRESNQRYLEKKQDILKKRRERAAARTEEQKERDRRYLKDWRRRNKSSISEKRRTFDSRYKQYQVSAKRRNYQFELTQEEFSEILIQPCTYCGLSPSLGIDRMNNSEGYILNNSVPCCEVCNKMKWKHSREDFLERIARIYRLNNR